MPQTRFIAATKHTMKVMANEAWNNEPVSSNNTSATATVTTASTVQLNDEATNTSFTCSEPASVHHEVRGYTTNRLEDDESHKTLRCKVDKQPEAEMKAPTNEKEKDDNDEIPFLFLCPITHELMTDPVRSPYGHSYQRSAIIEWLHKNGGQNSCPLTRQPLGPWQLATDQNLRLEIRQWQVLRGDKKPISIEPKSGEKYKEVFLLFVRVLLKHLQRTRSPLLVQVKNIIKEFQDRLSRGESCYLVNVRRKIKAIVPDRDWNTTEEYVRQILLARRRQLSATNGTR